MTNALVPLAFVSCEAWHLRGNMCEDFFACYHGPDVGVALQLRYASMTVQTHVVTLHLEPPTGEMDTSLGRLGDKPTE